MKKQIAVNVLPDPDKEKLEEMAIMNQIMALNKNKPQVKTAMQKMAFLQGYMEGLGKVAVISPPKPERQIGERLPESPAVNEVSQAVTKDPKKQKMIKATLNTARNILAPPPVLH